MKNRKRFESVMGMLCLKEFYVHYMVKMEVGNSGYSGAFNIKLLILISAVSATALGLRALPF